MINLIPKPGSKWIHTTGNCYKVLMIVNALTQHPDKYPVSVVYKNLHTGSVWCRPVSDWYRSMTEDSK